MTRRSSIRRRIQSSAPRTQATVELLEDKRLLTSLINVQGIYVDPTENYTFQIETQFITGGHSLEFLEIRIVGEEIWSLAKHQPPGGNLVTTVMTTVGDEVGVYARDLPIRHFAIGDSVGALTVSKNSGDDEPQVISAESVGSRDEFYDLIGDTETSALYVRPDAELAAWRSQIQTEIIEQADALYGEQFGKETSGPIYYHRGLWAADDFAIAFATDAEKSSDTNVQVDGVDEGDIVETDGEYIYTISGNEIVIVRAATADAEAEVLSRVELAETPRAMFLAGNRLTVISHEYGFSLALSASHWSPSQSRTVVTVLDVEDRQAPALVQESIVDGQYHSARAIGDQVYVVINNNEGIPYVPELNTRLERIDNDESLQDEHGIYESGYRFETREEYLKRVDEFVNGGRYQRGLTPPSAYRRGDGNVDQQGLERLGWLDGADTVGVDGGQLTSVLQFDATSGDSTPVSNIGVKTRRYGRTEIYSSATSLYLVTEEYTIANAGSGLTADLVVPQPSTIESRIHKIGLDTGKLLLEGEGVVPGNVESQFSIDEHNGYLRIVTTTGRNWWWTEQSSQNHLYVLQDNGDTLDIVGRVEDLAAGERIYSARFDGDRAWMVTFRQTDPVFSFDLSDPANPQVTGELKIPGYSDHLQLIDENHLLAIGRNATDEGRVQEVQVSLFDVSDMASPTLLHRYSLDSENWGHSEALQDHLAFNYLQASQILAVPFGTWGQQGIVLLHVDVTDGFERVGQVGGGPQIDLPYTGFKGWNQDNSYRRSVQIDDLLYTISAASIRVVDLNDPDTIVQTVTLQEKSTPSHTVPELPIEEGPLDDILRLTETLDEDGATEEILLRLEERLGEDLPDPDEIEEYEFRVLHPETGRELLRQAAPMPELVLADDDGGILDPGTYNVQFRTKVNRLQNPEFGAWSAPEPLAVRSERAELISERVLKFGERILEWSRIADRMHTPSGGSTAEANPVERYEVWINDAATNQRIKLEQDVARPELPLDLDAGGYFAWFRAIYADGTEGSWSLRERFQILGERLRGLVSPGITANRSPVFTLPDLADAESFEIEVTSPDGTVASYDATDPRSLRHEISGDLEPGQYSFRLRANLSSGVPTEWSDSVSFIVFGRPTLSANGKQLQLFSGEIDRVELWINKAGTSERVFHDTDFEAITVDDAIAELGLDADYLAGYDVWTRFTMADGSRTQWSAKALLNSQLASRVNVLPIQSMDVGERQAINWDEGAGIESFDVWVSKVGESGAFRRINDLTGTGYEFQDQLPEGNYRAWVRGKLVNGIYTAWGLARSFGVHNRPQLAIENRLASWSFSGDSDPNATYEIWINQLDADGGVLATKVIHATDIAAQEYDLSSLGDGLFRGWVRKITTDGDTTSRFSWSRGIDFATASLPDVASAFDEGVDIVLSALDRI